MSTNGPSLTQNGKPLDPLDFFQEECNHQYQFVRLYAINRAKLIAHAIGPKRTVEQLLPMLNNMSKQELYLNDDEFLFRLAEQYGEFLDLVGGNHSVMVKQVEWLAYQEETVIRDKAIEVLSKICDAGRVNVSEEIFPIVHRLSNADWFTARLSVCALFPACYARVNESQKQDLRKLYANLAADETPMVRRATALKLKDFSLQISKEHIGTEIIPVYKQLAQDDTQDIIRVACVHTTLALVETHYIKSPEDNKSQTLLVITNAAEDRSWRVRLTLADNFHRIIASFGTDMTQSFLINPFVSLLKDSEQDVRAAAVGVIEHLCHIDSFSVDQMQNIIVPQFASLSIDSAHVVRTALAQVIHSVCIKLKKEMTQKLLLNCVSDLLKDEHHEVRLAIIGHAAEISNVLGLEVVMGSLLTTIQSLVMDNQWRIRKSVLEQIPSLAAQFGPELFQTKLEAMFFNSLGDSVHAVRFAAVDNVGTICGHFGEAWTCTHLLPKIAEQYQTSAGFSTRITILHSLPQLSKVMTPEKISDHIAPLLLRGLKDGVPNVRYCACKLVKPICKTLSPGFVVGNVKGELEILRTDSDEDVVVEAVKAMQGLQEMGKLTA